MARTIYSAAEYLNIHNLLSFDNVFTLPQSQKSPTTAAATYEGCNGVITPQNGYLNIHDR
jgi:hypothetical protein